MNAGSDTDAADILTLDQASAILSEVSRLIPESGEWDDGPDEGRMRPAWGFAHDRAAPYNENPPRTSEDADEVLRTLHEADPTPDGLHSADKQRLNLFRARGYENEISGWNGQATCPHRTVPLRRGRPRAKAPT